jgi:hypothetical protein
MTESREYAKGGAIGRRGASRAALSARDRAIAQPPPAGFVLEELACDLISFLLCAIAVPPIAVWLLR